MSQILVLNCGSSSVKFALIDTKYSQSKMNGIAENIAQYNCKLVFQSDNKLEKVIPNGSYNDIFNELKKILLQQILLDSTIAIGHRVVHGGQYFSKSVIIDDYSLQKIKDCIPLAPLHNPANIEGIRFCQKIFPRLHQVAVFDTAFHQSIPNYIAEYAISREITNHYKVRKYGAHGTSHKYILSEVVRLLGKDKANIIVAHLGNGCSVTAVVDGKSFDTSMGLTPLDGLIMGTRSGSIDPSIFSYLADNLDWDICKITNMLNKQSGLFGVCGHNDMRKISKLADSSDEMCKLAIEMFCNRLAKFIASYMIYFTEFDALVFTAGIGENAVNIRANTIAKLNNIGFKIDQQKNLNSEIYISAEKSLRIMVIPTNEELMIAKEVQALI